MLYMLNVSVLSPSCRKTFLWTPQTTVQSCWYLQTTRGYPCRFPSTSSSTISSMSRSTPYSYLGEPSSMIFRSPPVEILYDDFDKGLHAFKRQYLHLSTKSSIWVIFRSYIPHHGSFKPVFLDQVSSCSCKNILTVSLDSWQTSRFSSCQKGVI